MLRLRAYCWLLSAVLAGTWLSLRWCPCLCTHVHYTNSSMLLSGVCRFYCCPFFFYMLLIAHLYSGISDALLRAAQELCKFCVCPFGFLCLARMGCQAVPSTHRKACWHPSIHPQPGPTPASWCTNKKKELTSPPLLLQRNAVNDSTFSIFRLLPSGFQSGIAWRLCHFSPLQEEKKWWVLRTQPWEPDWLY